MGEISHQIASVAENSIGARAGLAPGDIILEMNGAKIRDIFDYHYYSDDEVVDIKVQGADGSIRVCHVEKEIGEDLGITFENGLMDDYRSCQNQCIFCFIDQMPPGMRETLYFKDDDSRLSFLQGNYVTLTNMSEKDMEPDHPLSSGAHQYFRAYHESRASLRDAPQPVRRGML